jgi:hypothetical protein
MAPLQEEFETAVCSINGELPVNPFSSLTVHSFACSPVTLVLVMYLFAKTGSAFGIMLLDNIYVRVMKRQRLFVGFVLILGLI